MNMKKCSEINQKIWNAMERFKKTCDWNHGFEFWAHNMRFPFNFLSANSPKNGWKTHSKKWRKNGSHFKVPITLFHFGPGKFQWVACTWGPLGHSPPKAGVFSLNATMLEDVVSKVVTCPRLTPSTISTGPLAPIEGGRPHADLLHVFIPTSVKIQIGTAHNGYLKREQNSSGRE